MSERVHGHNPSGTANGSVHFHALSAVKPIDPNSCWFWLSFKRRCKSVVAHTGAKLKEPLSDQSKPSEIFSTKKIFHEAFTPLYCCLTWPGQIESLRGDVYASTAKIRLREDLTSFFQKSMLPFLPVPQNPRVMHQSAPESSPSIRFPLRSPVWCADSVLLYL